MFQVWGSGFEVSNSGFVIFGLGGWGFGVWGFGGLGVWDLGVWGAGFRVKSSSLEGLVAWFRVGFQVQGSEFGVSGLGIRVWGLGCGVQGPGFRGVGIRDAKIRV